MARDSRRSTGRSTKRGICVNNSCELYQKEQDVLHGNLVCQKCGKPLVPVKEKVSWMDKYGKQAMIAGVAIVALGGGGYATYSMLSNDGEASGEEVNIVQDTTKVDVQEVVTELPDENKNEGTSTVTTETANKPKEQGTNGTTVKQPVNGTGTLQLSYGTYKGDIKNGYPDGIGSLTFSRSRQINRYDSEGRVAEPGDRLQGEFVRGFFIMGKWYDSEGNLKASLNIGVQPGNGYESK